MAIAETQTGKRTQSFKTCKECAAYFGKKDLPDWMVKTELCLVFLNENWSKDVIEAIDTLKKAGISGDQYSSINRSCKVRKGKL
jgi:hypothetical protein